MPKGLVIFLFVFSGVIFAAAGAVQLPEHGNGMLDGIGAGCLGGAIFTGVVRRLMERELPQKVDAMAQDRAARYIAEAAVVSMRPLVATGPLRAFRARWPQVPGWLPPA